MINKLYKQFYYMIDAGLPPVLAFTYAVCTDYYAEEDISRLRETVKRLLSDTVNYPKKEANNERFH
jgi:hypothetical protein